MHLCFLHMMTVIGLCIITLSFTTRTNKREVNNITPYLGLLRPFLENSGVSPGIWCLGVSFLSLFCADNRICVCLNVCVFRLQAPLHEQQRGLPQTCSEEDFKIKAPTLSEVSVYRKSFNTKFFIHKCKRASQKHTFAYFKIEIGHCIHNNSNTK